jgi:hypothetical protein
MDELNEKIKARRPMFSGEKPFEPSSKFSDDKKLFEQAKIDEEKRQARAEELDNKKIIEALKTEATKKNTPTPIHVKPGENPLPPPEPNFMHYKPFGIKVQLDKKTQRIQTKKDKQPFMSQEELNKITKGLTKPKELKNSPPDTSAQITDFRANLKKTNKGGRQI